MSRLAIVLVRGSSFCKQSCDPQFLQALSEVAQRQVRNLVGVSDGFTLGHGLHLDP